MEAQQHRYRVITFGNRRGMRTFGKTWPTPLSIYVDEPLSECDRPALDALLDMIDELSVRQGGTWETLVLDIVAPSIRAVATGPLWRDEHRGFFERLMRRWIDRHMVVLAPMTQVRYIEPYRETQERRPDMPPSIISQTDVVLRYDATENEYLTLPDLARCVQHRRDPQMVGLTTQWDAALILGQRPPPQLEDLS